MADCHSEFQDYLKELDLLDGQEEKLRTSRDALRNKVSSYFKEKELLVPEYQLQGSYALGTQNGPLRKEDEFDLDDGVYLKHRKNEFETHIIDGTEMASPWNILTSKQTSVDGVTIDEAFKLVSDAVEGHTDTPSPKKDTCVRVIYKPVADGAPAHHIDLAIYRIDSQENKWYAHRGKGWRKSDQRGFIDWFKERESPQLKSIVRILKGWADQNKAEGSKKLPSGYHLTVLAVNCFCETQGRDDTALVKTAEAMRDLMMKSYQGIIPSPIKRPVEPFEDIFEDFSKDRIGNFVDRLKDLAQRGDQALTSRDKQAAIDIWHNLLGDRIGESKKTEYEEKWEKGPAILGTSGKAG